MGYSDADINSIATMKEAQANSPASQMKDVQLKQAQLNLKQDQATTAGSGTLSAPNSPITPTANQNTGFDFTKYTKSSPSNNSQSSTTNSSPATPATPPAVKKPGFLETMLSGPLRLGKGLGNSMSTLIDQNNQDSIRKNNEAIMKKNMDLALKLKAQGNMQGYQRLIAENVKLGNQGSVNAQTNLTNTNTQATKGKEDLVKGGVGTASWFVPGKGYLQAGVSGGMLGYGASDKGNEISSTAGGVIGGLLGKGVTDVAGLAAKTIFKGIPTRIMNSVFREPIKATTASIKGGSTLGQDVLNRGGVGTTEGFYQTALNKIKELEDSLQSKLLSSTATVSTTEIRKSVDPVIAQLKQAGNSEAANSILDRITAIEKESGTVIPVARANEIKRTIYDELRRSYGGQGSANTELLKNVARAFKDQIGQVDGVSQINKDLSYYGRVADAMASKLTTSGRNNLSGLTDTILGTGSVVTGNPAGIIAMGAKHLLGSTIGKTAIAQGMKKLGQIGDTKLGQTVGNGLGEITKAMTKTGGAMVGNSASVPVMQKTQQATQNNSTNIDHTTNLPQNPSDVNLGTKPTTPLAGYTVDGQPLSSRDAAIIDGITNYKLDLSKITSLRSDERTRIAGLAAQYDPTWDMSQYPARQALRKDFTSGNTSRNIRSLNTAIGHLKSLSDAGGDLGNIGIPVINTLKNTAGVALGQPQKVKFDNAINAVAGEMSTVFKGASGTDQEIKSWKDQMNSSQSPAQIKEGINLMIELMGSRLSSFDAQWTSGMGKPRDFTLLSPKSRQILGGLGVDVNALDPTVQ